MVPADRRKGDGGDDVDHHPAPADELVGREDLKEDRQGGEEEAVRSVRQNIPDEVLAEFDLRPAADCLEEHRRHHADQQGRDQHKGDRKGLGEHEGPVRDGGGLDDLVGASVALAPHQLPRIVDGDDDREEDEGARDLLDHQPRGRVHGRAVDLAAEPDVREAEDQAKRQEDHKAGAQHHLGDVEPGARKELLQG